eukprot:gnl/TRDRNA2_/TRDRNA2_100207_c2_seq1.p1 gnl/TRDRNA2_/TRDRNA2_100207_c2~~gnl/TRDRNA2_/TRDRNA2_100207_c2_seq1.p1  ORF type:complete len:206 (+),score=20.41 gnl/TRDRNA2_/TRDRNA2_100207_c2_seq1:53-619(+)
MEFAVCPVSYIGGCERGQGKPFPASWAPDGCSFFLLEATGGADAELREGAPATKLSAVASATPRPTPPGLCQGIHDGTAIPRGLLQSSGVNTALLCRGTALQVAGAHCLKHAGNGARLYEDGEIREVDPDDVDWLPVWVAAEAVDGDSVDLLHEDGTVEVGVTPERLRMNPPGARNQFGPHLSWLDTE